MLHRDSAGLEHERNTPVPGSASGAATASGGRKAHRAQTAPHLDGLAPRSKSGCPPPQTRLRSDIPGLRCLFPSNPSDEVDRGARKARLVPRGSLSGIGESAPLRKHAAASDLLRATTATRTRRRFRRMTNLRRKQRVGQKLDQPLFGRAAVCGLRPMTLRGNADPAVAVDAGREASRNPKTAFRRNIGAIVKVEAKNDPSADFVDVLPAGSGAATELDLDPTPQLIDGQLHRTKSVRRFGPAGRVACARRPDRRRHADERSRTSTELPPLVPETSASANSATSAGCHTPKPARDIEAASYRLIPGCPARRLRG